MMPDTFYDGWSHVWQVFHWTGQSSAMLGWLAAMYVWSAAADLTGHVIRRWMKGGER